MTPPIRIQRKRIKGFNLQAQSPDGRPVVSVCRPGKWGNIFYIGDISGTETVEEAVKKHRVWVLGRLWQEGDYLAELRGKHLACFCPTDSKHCHADTLLKLSNQ